MIQCDPTSPKHRTANATGSANCWADVCGAVRRHDTVSSSSVCLSVALGKMSFLTDTDMFTYYIVCRWASHSPDRALSCFTWKLHLAPASKLPRLLKHKVLSPRGIVVLVFYSGWFLNVSFTICFHLGWVMVRMSVSARQTFWKQVFRFKVQFNERS